MSKYIDKSKNKKLYIVTSSLLGSLAFVMFYLWGGFPAAFLTVLLLGLAGSLNASNTYALQLKVSQTLGGGKTMSVLSTIDRTGQILGPIVFGWLLMTMEIGRGITYLGVSFFFVTILFFLSAQGFRKMAMSSDRKRS